MPEYGGEFDAASEYRLYSSNSVPVGTLKSVFRNNVNDGVQFEIWKSNGGASFRHYVDANGRSETYDSPIYAIERLVWIGHKTVWPVREGNVLDLDGSGWILEFTRKS